MRRAIGIALMFLMLLTAGACAPGMVGTTTYYGFSVDVRSAPPPPRVVWVREPDVVLVPGSSVYIVEDVPYDMFLYGSTYYLSSGGYWYRAGSSQGPFAVVDVRSVPRPVLTVPERHWKRHPHGRPPGLEKQERREHS